VSRIARAQTYPTRPVRVVVPFAAGGTGDILGRLMSQWLSERLGQPFIVENRAGAGANTGTDAVVKAAPDGYTILLFSSAAFTNAALYDKLNYNFVRDIAPVASIANSPFVIVTNPTFSAKTVSEFIAYAKANPDKIAMGSSGPGSSTHVTGELFKAMAGIGMVHVPYRGDAPALTDLIGGQLQVYFSTMGSAIEYIRTGKLRALAVTTATRARELPDVPTAGEFVPGYEASLWVGLGSPRATPAEIIDRLNKEVNAGLADPTIEARLADLVMTGRPSAPAEFGKLIAAETEKWGKVVRTANIKVQ
jgi:tripartite-type tricarboxylate transporter receptor subunit TctC